jgi:hypothetical protein
MRKLLALCIALAVTLGAANSYGQGFNGGCWNCGPQGHSSGGGGVTWAFKTSAVGGGGTSVGLGSLSIGTTVSSDIVVAIVANGLALPTGVSIAGNAMTAVSGASDNSAVDDLTMWYLTGVTLGATSAVTVTSGSTMDTAGVMIGVISGSATPTPASGASIAASFANPFTTGPQTVPSGGIAIIGSAMAVAFPGSWTNATQDSDINRFGTEHDVMAHTANGTGASITATYVTGGNQNHGIVGVWGP